MAARGASARTDRLAPRATREPMRRISLGMSIACLTVRLGDVCATLVKSSNVEYI